MSSQDELYEQVAAEFNAALGRLAYAYEADSDRRRDLLQEIHLALWRSFEAFQGRCSLRTWVYRVAHNTAISWAMKQRRARTGSLISLDEIDVRAVAADADREVDIERLRALIRRLKPLDRTIILAYLEGIDACGIAELTGLSAGNAATKIHRIKQVLARNFKEGPSHVH